MRNQEFGVKKIDLRAKSLEEVGIAGDGGEDSEDMAFDEIGSRHAKAAKSGVEIGGKSFGGMVIGVGRGMVIGGQSQKSTRIFGQFSRFQEVVDSIHRAERNQAGAD